MLEKIKGLLPIGSVVQLRDSGAKLIVSGYLQENPSSEDEKPERYDYAGLPYPLGFIGKEDTFVFNRDMIEKVLHRGYEDEARAIFMQKLSDVIEEEEDSELHLLEEL